METKAISVVIPCFNEEKRIGDNLRKINEYLSSNFSDYEIIAVNDGSTDSTVSEIRKAQEKFPIRLVDMKVNGGKGSAVKKGMLESEKDVVMFMDADLAIPIEELKKFLEKLESGYDIVIASRFIPGLRILEPVLWHRRIMEKIFRILRIIIIDMGEIRDTQCGFKVFRRKAAVDIFSKLTVKRFSFDSEIIFIASKKGYGIKELPIILQNPKKSHVRLIFDSVNMIADLLRIRIKDFRGKYD